MLQDRKPITPLEVDVAKAEQEVNVAIANYFCALFADLRAKGKTTDDAAHIALKSVMHVSSGHVLTLVLTWFQERVAPESLPPAETIETVFRFLVETVINLLMSELPGYIATVEDLGRKADGDHATRVS